MLRQFLGTGRFFEGVGLSKIFDAKDQEATSANERDRFYYSHGRITSSLPGGYSPKDKSLMNKSFPLCSGAPVYPRHWEAGPTRGDPMSRTLSAIGAFTALTMMAGPASARDAYQVRHELQERGYYSIRFVDARPPHFRVNACRGGERFVLHVSFYGRITERDAIGPCHRYWWSWRRDNDNYR